MDTIDQNTPKYPETKFQHFSMYSFIHNEVKIEVHWSEYTRKNPKRNYNSFIYNMISNTVIWVPMDRIQPKYPETKFQYLPMYTFISYVVITALLLRIHPKDPETKFWKSVQFDCIRCQLRSPYHITPERSRNEITIYLNV